MMKRVSGPVAWVRQSSWDDCRALVQALNPTLHQIIEAISPSKKYLLWEVEYQYGEKIVELGKLCLPNAEGRLLPIDHASTLPLYREQLSYAAIPLILQLTRGNELFLEQAGHSVPLRIVLPGDVYGTCDLFSSYSVTAGARSVFLAAKVTDALSHKRLRMTYPMSLHAPKKLSEHWQVMKAISNSSGHLPWKCKVLIFGKEWFSDGRQNAAWAPLAIYLQQQMRRFANHAQQWLMGAQWRSFTAQLQIRQQKLSAYVRAVMLHLIGIAHGWQPGFIAADLNETLLPLCTIEHAYTHIYQLKEYAPIILQPWQFKRSDGHTFAYYPLCYPALLEFLSPHSLASRLLGELHEIQQWLKLLHDKAEVNPFNYFHYETDPLGEIKPSPQLLHMDVNLKRCLERFPGKIFPSQGPGFKACIQIRKCE